MLSIVMAQRDRYRAKATSLQAQADGLREEMARLHAHNGQLKQDNLTLYEKIRFLSAYPRITNGYVCIGIDSCIYDWHRV